MLRQNTINYELFMKDISTPEGVVDLSKLKKVNGGGTHDIYQSENHPDILLKVMKHSVGRSAEELGQEMSELDAKYALLYETFSPTRCIVERHLVTHIQDNSKPEQRNAVVSIVPFEPCFGSKEQAGFNVHPTESDELLVKSKRYLHGRITRSFLGDLEKPNPYVMRNYHLIDKAFHKIFSLIDNDASFANAMKEFLTKYKDYYEKSGILLDTIGLDNVLFYKDENGWQFKLGSVIKHDTGILTKQMLEVFQRDPTIIDHTSSAYSFKAYTSICFMPACIRALNACAAKCGMPDKVVSNIVFNEKLLGILAETYQHLAIQDKMYNYAVHGKFADLLLLFDKYCQNEKSHDARIRDEMGVRYWKHIKEGGAVSSIDEVNKYMALLLDPKNDFPEHRKVEVNEAIGGLKAKIESMSLGMRK